MGWPAHLPLEGGGGVSEPADSVFKIVVWNQLDDFFFVLRLLGCIGL